MAKTLTRLSLTHPHGQSDTIRESIAQDVDLLAWYRDRSSSSIVDEALMEHLERCKAELKSARKLWESKKV